MNKRLVETIVRREIRRKLDESKGPIGRPKVGTLPAIVVVWRVLPSSDPSARETEVVFSQSGVEIFRTQLEASRYDDPDPEQDISTALQQSPIRKGLYTLGQLGSNWILVRASPDSTFKKT